MGCPVSKNKTTVKVAEVSTSSDSEISEKGRLQHYKFQKELGQGKYGRVFLARSTEEDRLVAIKLLSKSGETTSLEDIEKEIKLLSSVDHPNIVKYYRHFQTDENTCLVMEHCGGGDLFNKILSKEYFPEDEAALLMSDILRAVNHCHTIGLIHRDLKPENILFTEDGQVKLIDFGLSMAEKSFSKEKIAGTAHYIAPEIIEDHIFTKACDMWSLGVILYLMLSGYLPVKGNNSEEVLANIQYYSGPRFSQPIWERVSKDAKDLIRSMLNTDYTSRISAADALKHPWIQKFMRKSPVPQLSLLPKLEDYSFFNKLKKKALRLLVNKLSRESSRRFQNLFFSLDEDMTGILTQKNLQRILQKESPKLSDSELNSLLCRINPEGEGFLFYTDFVAALIERSEFFRTNYLQAVFAEIDTNETGFLVEDELKYTLAKHDFVLGAELRQIIKEADYDNDGKISFEDFKRLVCEKC